MKVYVCSESPWGNDPDYHVRVVFKSKHKAEEWVKLKEEEYMKESGGLNPHMYSAIWEEFEVW